VDIPFVPISSPAAFKGLRGFFLAAECSEFNATPQPAIANPSHYHLHF
jgi:hypothetical protein